MAIAPLAHMGGREKRLAGPFRMPSAAAALIPGPRPLPPPLPQRPALRIRPHAPALVTHAMRAVQYFLNDH
ncbi:hypothetical protein NCCP1664_22610 [Zafaria cholistanensis]|uniref:Uncharacterized protein n=1 Tax=Zafaria cholistanensis TaxID=1682741 RepID=A0A5A7NT58_9MICC|nr:hypothetical protein NCCP1664_22610 [Zafaria cholistanensis]